MRVLGKHLDLFTVMILIITCQVAICIHNFKEYLNCALYYFDTKKVYLKEGKNLHAGMCVISI